MYIDDISKLKSCQQRINKIDTEFHLIVIITKNNITFGLCYLFVLALQNDKKNMVNQMQKPTLVVDNNSVLRVSFIIFFVFQPISCWNCHVPLIGLDKQVAVSCSQCVSMCFTHDNAEYNVSHLFIHIMMQNKLTSNKSYTTTYNYRKIDRKGQLIRERDWKTNEVILEITYCRILPFIGKLVWILISN